MIWLLIRLLFARKPETKSKLRLRIGAYYLKKGAVIQVGQPIKLAKTETRKKETTRWVENIYYNFRQDRVTPKLAAHPIKGHSERFQKTKLKKA